MEIPEMLQVSTIRVKYQFTRRVEQAQFYSSGKLVFWKVYEQKTTFIEEISVLFSLHDNHSLYSTYRNKKMDTTIRTLYDISDVIESPFLHRWQKETWFRLPNYSRYFHFCTLLNYIFQLG